MSPSLSAATASATASTTRSKVRPPALRATCGLVAALRAPKVSAAKAGQVAAAAPASRPRQGPVLPAPLLAPLPSQLPPPPSQQRPSLQARPQLLLGPPVQLQLDAPLRVSPWLWAWMLLEQHACCRWGALALPRWPQKCVEGLLGQTAPTSRATIYSVLGRAIDSYCTIECLCCQARCPSGEQ